MPTKKNNNDQLSFLEEGECLEHRKLYDVPTELLNPNPDQPRKYFDDQALDELKMSIDSLGILHPVIFRKSDEGMLFLISGGRRLQASILLQRESIPAIYHEEGNSAEIALVENLMREDLNPIEEAEALSKLKEEQGYSLKQLSSVIGKAKSTISEILSLTKLPEAVKDECREGVSFPRRSLVEVAKGGSKVKMEKLFKKLKSQKLKSDDVREERSSHVTPLDSLRKSVERFQGLIDKIDFSVYGGDVEIAKGYLLNVIESTQSKLNVDNS